jgi:hypothetical protein
MNIRTLCSAGAMLFLLGCGDSEAGADVVPDTTSDAALDVSQDTAGDAGADAALDTAADPDISEDKGDEPEDEKTGFEIIEI